MSMVESEQGELTDDYLAKVKENHRVGVDPAYFHGETPTLLAEIARLRLLTEQQTRDIATLHERVRQAEVIIDSLGIFVQNARKFVRTNLLQALGDYDG